MKSATTPVAIISKKNNNNRQHNINTSPTRSSITLEEEAEETGGLGGGKPQKDSNKSSSASSSSSTPSPNSPAFNNNNSPSSSSTSPSLPLPVPVKSVLKNRYVFLLLLSLFSVLALPLGLYLRDLANGDVINWVFSARFMSIALQITFNLFLLSGWLMVFLVFCTNKNCSNGNNSSGGSLTTVGATISPTDTVEEEDVEMEGGRGIANAPIASKRQPTGSKKTATHLTPPLHPTRITTTTSSPPSLFNRIYLNFSSSPHPHHHHHLQDYRHSRTYKIIITLQTVMILSLTLFFFFLLIFRSGQPVCHQFRGILTDWACNPYKEVPIFPMDTAFFLIFIPFLFAIINKEKRFLVTIICWFISVMGMTIAAIILESKNAGIIILLYTVLSTLLLIDSFRIQTLIYELYRQLRQSMEENQALLDQQKLNQMRDVIGNVSHDLKTVRSSLLLLLLFSLLNPSFLLPSLLQSI